MDGYGIDGLIIKLMIMLIKTLNRLVKENNIDPDEFDKDPYGVIDRLEDEELKLLIIMAMELMD